MARNIENLGVFRKTLSDNTLRYIWHKYALFSHAKGVLLLCRLAHIALQERPSRTAIWAKRQSKTAHFGLKMSIF